MIICEHYQQSDSLYKIYSDKNVLIIKNGYYYDALITSTNNTEGIIESTIGIPEEPASNQFIVETLTEKYGDITPSLILKGKNVLNNIFRDINTNEIYYLIYLIAQWKPENTYYLNDKVRFNGRIYKVIANEVQNKLPTNTEYYAYIEKPQQYIEKWSINKIPYNEGDEIRIGNYIYVSKINGNNWSPQDFPAAWQLKEGSQV